MDKAVWDDETTEIFVNACIEQVYKKERRGQSFSKKAWGIIVSTFNAKTGKDYDRKKLKNRLDILKKDFKTWDSLIKETGVGIDHVTKKVMATNEWWQRKLQEKPAYRKFRHTGLKFENELRIIFKDAMASGEDVVVPSVTQPQTQQEDEEEDVYRPTMDEEEGSGDSEDDMFGANPVPSTGVTDELASIGLTTSTPSNGGTESGSRGKRKMGEGSGKRKKQKMPASRQIADAISVMANASKDRTATLDAMNDVSVDSAMSELLGIEEVIRDKSFRHRCIKLIENKTHRETFMSLCKRNMEFVVPWLEFMIYES